MLENGVDAHPPASTADADARVETTTRNINRILRVMGGTSPRTLLYTTSVIEVPIYAEPNATVRCSQW